MLASRIWKKHEERCLKHRNRSLPFIFASLSLSLSLTNHCRVQILDAFRGVSIVENLLQDAPAAVAKNVAVAKKKLAMALIMQIAAIICVWLTNFFQMIENPKLSLFPVLGIIWFGISLTAVAFNIMKLRNAQSLSRNIPSKSVLSRVLDQRKLISRVQLML